MQPPFALGRLQQGGAPATTGRLTLSEAQRWQALTVLLFAIGAIVGVVMPGDDVSWLITCAERMLNGERLYIDIFETNPPMSILLYAPAVLASRLVGTKPELWVDAMAVGGAALSLRLSGVLLVPVIGPDPARRWKLAAAGAFVFTVLPSAVFAQREHLAAIALLPFVALCVARAEGKPPARRWAALAGFGVGLAVCIKPHFAAVAAFPLLWSAWRTRSFRLWSHAELWAAALVVIAYAAIVVLGFPAYFDFFPLVRDAYLPMRQPLWALLTLHLGIPMAGVAVLAALRTRLSWRWLATPFLAALGGAVALLVQGKGWPYHSYPMLAFACVGLFAAAIMADEGEQQSDWAKRVWLVLPALFSIGWFSIKDDFSALAGPVRAVSHAPRMLYLGTDTAAAFPMVRNIGGTWVGTESNLWIYSNVSLEEQRLALSPSRRRRLDDLVRFERRLVAHDIRTRHPDVILVDSVFAPVAVADPDLAPALRAYQPVSAADGVQVWAHRPPRG